MSVSVIVGCSQYDVEAGKTISEVLEGFHLNPIITAVQLNHEFLRGESLKTRTLSEGDVLECLVQCAGGSGSPRGATATASTTSSKNEQRQAKDAKAAKTSVTLFHNGDPAVLAFGETLARSLGSAFEVRDVDFSKAAGDVVVPPALIESMATYGTVCLPAIVVNDVVFKRGSLPSMDNAVGLITRGEPSDADAVELDLQLAQSKAQDGAGCCGPGASSSSCCAPSPSTKSKGKCC